MAENFDKYSKYVKKIVADALEDIKDHGNQETLLVYLAIMKYFGDKGLPSSHCHSFIDTIGCANIKNTLSVLDELCNQAKIFVVERSTDKSNKFLEISHEPVAYQIIEKFTGTGKGKKAKLQKYFVDLLNEKKFMEKRFLLSEVHMDIKEILGKYQNLGFCQTKIPVSIPARLRISVSA